MRNTKKALKKDKTGMGIHLFFIIFSIVCLIPFMTVISASFSEEKDLLLNGFPVWPRKWDITAYAYLLENPDIIFNAYAVTIYTTIIGTFLGVLFMSMTAFCLARDESKMKKILTFYIFFPTLFSGGLVPSYIINTQYLHLSNKLAVLILPSLINIFHVFMLRTFMKQLPASLYEAAKMDGASEYSIFFRIAIPLSKPSLATVAFLNALAKWNQWYDCMLYIRDDEKATLQYLLQRMMKNIQALQEAMEHTPEMVNIQEILELPGENLRMAMLVVAIGPMMIFFPFFQKYFTKGMTVGAVKG